VGPRAGLDVMEKRNFFFLQGIEPRILGRRARCLVSIPTELYTVSSRYDVCENTVTSLWLRDDNNGFWIG
jgi:hypothetical protein